MEYLDLSLIKQHLNIESGFTEDDTYLEHLGGVVEQVVERHIDDSLDVLAANNGTFSGGTLNPELPMPLIQAMLLLLGTYYANRENVSFACGFDVPQTYNYLIDLYRNYGTGIEDTMNIIKEITDLLNSQKDTVTEIESYVAEDSQKEVNVGNGLVISGDLKQTISVGNIDLGDY